MSSVEDALNIKWKWVWEHVHSILGATSCTPMVCLSTMLQVLQCLPCIPWNLSFQMGVPTAFAYDPEVHEFLSWDSSGDGGAHLDMSSQVVKLPDEKLIDCQDGADFQKDNQGCPTC